MQHQQPWVSRQLGIRAFCTALLIVCFGIIGCGKDKDNGGGSSEDLTTMPACGKGGDQSPESIRLKGTSLLAQSLEYTLGPGKDINVNATEERLLETYSSNFGNSQGLSFGEIYADVKSSDIKMTGYMMGLNIVAFNAALRCASDRDEAKCGCDTEATATAMLRRAVPYMRFCQDQDDSYVLSFTELCKEDQVSAITALISSVAFAMRN